MTVDYSVLDVIARTHVRGPQFAEEHSSSRPMFQSEAATIVAKVTVATQWAIKLRPLTTLIPETFKIDHISLTMRHVSSASMNFVKPRPITSQPGSPLFLM